MKTYIEAIEKLDKTNWCQLSIQDKIDVLQCIENEFAKRTQRIPCPVSGYTDRPNVMGHYDRETQCIRINIEELASGTKYGDDFAEHLDTVLHEGRHAYQDQAVRGLIVHPDQAEVERWRDNLLPGHYISYSELPEEYFKQPVEADAFSYAETMKNTVLQERSEYMVAEKDIQKQNNINLNSTNENLHEYHRSDSSFDIAAKQIDDKREMREKYRARHNNMAGETRRLDWNKEKNEMKERYQARHNAGSKTAEYEAISDKNEVREKYRAKHNITEHDGEQGQLSIRNENQEKYHARRSNEHTIRSDTQASSMQNSNNKKQDNNSPRLKW